MIKNFKFINKLLTFREKFNLLFLNIVGSISTVIYILYIGDILNFSIIDKKLDYKRIVLFLIFIIIKILTEKIKDYYIALISYKKENYLIRLSLEKIIDTSVNHPYLVDKYELNNKIRNDVRRIANFLKNTFPFLFYFPFLFIISFINIISINKVIGFTIFFVTIVTSFINIRFTDLIVKSIKENVKSGHSMMNYEQDVINNKTFIRSYKIFNFVDKHYKNYLDEYLLSEKNRLKVEYYSYIPGLLNEYLPLIIFCLISFRPIKNREISYGEFVVLMSLIGYVSLPFTNFIRSINRLKALDTYIENINSLITLKKYKDVNLENTKNIIEIKDLSFKYTNNYIFKNLHFTLQRGEKILLKGVSGTGKSTLIKLILGSLKANGSYIRVFGLDPYIYINTIYKKIGIIDKDQEFFNKDIYYNVSMKNKLSKSEKKTIDQLMYILKFSDYNPLKIVEIDGSNLSGGERLKILIARNLFSKKELLILDEPDFALDRVSVVEFYSFLEKLDLTVLVVSHNEKIEKFFDKILKIEDLNGNVIC